MTILKAVIICVLVCGFFAWIACAEAQADERQTTAANECPGELSRDGTSFDLKSIRDGDLSCLNHARYSKVQFVIVWAPEFNDESAAYLSQMSLSGLVLHSTKITDEGLKHLANLPLRWLNLDNTKVTSAGLEPLRGLPIADLSLRFTEVDDRAIELLSALPLEEVYLTGPRITSKGKDRLAKALPKAKVDYAVPLKPNPEPSAEWVCFNATRCPTELNMPELKPLQARARSKILAAVRREPYFDKENLHEGLTPFRVVTWKDKNYLLARFNYFHPESACSQKLSVWFTLDGEYTNTYVREPDCHRSCLIGADL